MSTSTCQSTTSSPRGLIRSRSHAAKSRSIGSLPLPHSLRLTPTIPIHLDPPSAPSLHMSSPILSPSRLPATESMSYFPPFESMGSGPDEDGNAEAGPSQPRQQPEENPSAEIGHVKGRSLGSLAGLMSFLSPGISPHRPSPTPLHMTRGQGEEMYRSSSDGDVLQALTKRVTPGKRRVLEPISVSSNEALPEIASDVKLQRRKTCLDARTLRRARENVFEDVSRENVINASRPRRRPKPQLVLSSLPQWRFPMPSPPVTSLSPDIPLSAFSPIENPASNPSSTESSPSKPLTPSSLSLSHQYDPDHDSDDLSPTASFYGTLSSGPSRPTTPSDEWSVDDASPRSMRINTNMREYEEGRLYPRLERSVSQKSSDSKETIRPCKEIYGVETMLDGETTPKAGRGWQVV